MKTWAPKHTAAPWDRNIRPASKYPTIFSGRNNHIAVLDTQGKTQAEIESNADLIAAAPLLLNELIIAHQIIRNGLNLMTPEQQAEWSRINDRQGLIDFGATRATERERVIDWATGEGQ